MRCARILAALFVLAAPLCVRAQHPRMVFAHYMLANAAEDPTDPTGEHDIAAFQQEIRQAQALGIDGFALNAGGWFREPRYIRRASLMFEAALRLHTGFVLFFSADMCCGADATDLLDMMRRFAGNPRYATVYFHYQNRAVLSTFSGSAHGPAFWHDLLHALATGSHPSLTAAPCRANLCPLSADQPPPSNAPLPTFFVPSFFFGGELPQAQDIANGLSIYGNLLDGAFYWGIAGVPGLGHIPDQLPSSAAYAQVLHHAGKLYMAPICPGFWGANAGRYYSYSGFTGLETMWRSAIDQTHPEWVEIITWNDFVEGTYITPSSHRTPDGGNSIYGPFPSHAGTAKLMAYFIRWYKAGQQPPITANALLWSYRTHLAPTASSSLRLYGPMDDSIHLTTLLQHPDTLKVTLDSHTIQLKLPAGLHDTSIPLAYFLSYTPRADEPATPTFTLGHNTSQGEDPIHRDHTPNLYDSTGTLTTRP